jgi:hypothetical protein
MAVPASNGLSRGEIIKLVNRYIGVSGGYLGDFSYRTHGEFYAEFCDLDLDPFEYLADGTTRERFIVVLENHLRTTRRRSFGESLRSTSRRSAACSA